MPTIGEQNTSNFPLEESVIVADRPMSATFLHKPTNKLFTLRKDNPSLANYTPSPTEERVLTPHAREAARFGDAMEQWGNNI